MDENEETLQGQMIINVLISVMLGLLILFYVVLPVINDALYGPGSTAANLSGSALTIAKLLPLLLVVAGMLLVVGIFALVSRGS